MAKQKKVKTILKLVLPAGKANPAPPIGPALGQHGVNIMEFCNAYNAKTKDKMGQVLPAEVTIYEDRSFDFIIKLPPVSELIKQELKLKKGGAAPGRDQHATITMDQVETIATEKMPDLNTIKLESAKNSVIGTARSMGIAVAA